MAAPQEPMSARRQLRLAAVAALEAVKAAAQIATIDSPGDLLTPPEKMPAIQVRTNRRRLDSNQKGMPSFNSNVTLEIDGRVEATSGPLAQDAIEALGYVIENALFCDQNVVGMISQIVSVDEEVDITAEGKKHIGSIKMAIVCEMFEAFDPTATPPAQTTWPPVISPPVPLISLGIHLDLLDPYDPSGTYTVSADSPSYTPTTAPRTSGPDGRDEGSLDIPLT